MQAARLLFIAVSVIGMLAGSAAGRINIVVIHNDDNNGRELKLRIIPPPSSTDAATDAEISILSGTRDRNGGDVDKLQDGRTPTESDQPRENFFFNYSGGGGRLLFDLKELVAIEQINTYSWHPNTRGPQVYDLYVSEGKSEGFNARPGEGADLEASGWKLIAKVDTRPDDIENEGGQYGVSIFDSDGPIGLYRYLLFDVSRTESRDIFGNTFYSEIDVVASDAPRASELDQAPPFVIIMESDAGAFQATIDTSETPDLTEWANTKLAPVVKDWYPKIVAMLPSDEYEAPRSFTIGFRPDYRGVAATGGTRVFCNPDWFRRNLEGEAIGAVVHELVHVVQQYGQARRRNPEARRPPGWLVEGIADYIRWFLYEPQTRGAEINARNLDRARYNASYRISANFLNWVTESYDRDVVAKLNAALREGSYDNDIWTEYTNRTLTELDDEWRAHLTRLASLPADEPAAARESGEDAPINTLADEEKAAGWKLLFNGRNMEGWHNFRSDDIRPGWRVTDGVLTCADPSDAGDLCSDEQFEWFELQIEYKISEGGNSGIMYRVSDRGRTAWSTGPEIQLLDNAKGHDPQQSGWLYALYQTPTDPATGKPLDATKPAGQWNHLRILVTPEKCVHTMNGVKYVEYQLGSDDFNERVSKSKFARMRRFAREDEGSVALQGDHGQVSFRNIKIRPIEPEKSENAAGE